MIVNIRSFYFVHHNIPIFFTIMFSNMWTSQVDPKQRGIVFVDFKYLKTEEELRT